MSNELQLFAFNSQLSDGVLVLQPRHMANPVAHLEPDLMAIRSYLEPADTCNVVFDLDDIDLFGSEFVGILVSISQTVDEIGGEFVFCHVNDYSRSVFSCLHLFETRPFYNRLEDAVEQFQSVGELSDSIAEVV